MLMYAQNTGLDFFLPLLQGFFIALRLVASAQGGNDISLNNLNQNLGAPKFVSVKMNLLLTAISSYVKRNAWVDEKYQTINKRTLNASLHFFTSSCQYCMVISYSHSFSHRKTQTAHY